MMTQPMIAQEQFVRMRMSSLFFFSSRRRHTRLQGDWSSDVCSSDLNRLNTLYSRDVLDRFRHYQRPSSQQWRWTIGPVGAAIVAAAAGEPLPRPAAEIGRASCRERV